MSTGRTGLGIGGVEARRPGRGMFCTKAGLRDEGMCAGKGGVEAGRGQMNIEDQDA